MTNQQHHEGEQKQPAHEKQADRVERKSEQKAGAEASHGMEDRNKTIVAEVLKKRHERKSGGTMLLKPIQNPGDAAHFGQLSAENKPLITELGKEIDQKFGTHTSPPHEKDLDDIIKKTIRASDKDFTPGIEHIRDALRFKTVTEDIDSLPNIVEHLKNSDFQIIKKDFEAMEDPKGRGWRMVAFDLRAPNGQFLEYQIRVKEMDVANELTHPVYKKWREIPISSLSEDQKFLRQDDYKRCRDIHNQAWRTYLERTRQTLQHVKAVCDQAMKLLEKGL